MLLALGAVAHADAEQTASSRLRYPLIVVESALVIVPPTIYYWRDVEDQKEDWELRWDWASWKSKLFTTNELILDTNRFEANAARHPMSGALHFQSGRANGFGVVGSSVLAFATSVFWEYVVEYRERVSVNDIIANTVSGISVGEPLYQIGLTADATDAGWARRALGFAASPFDRVQKALDWSPRTRRPRPWTDFAFTAGAASHAGRPEGTLGLELGLVTVPGYGQPGERVAIAGPGSWNRVALDLRVGDAPETLQLPGIRFRSSTDYIGRYARAFDERGDGSDLALALGTAFELDARKLPEEWDKVGIFQLVGPRVEGRRRSGRLQLRYELGGYADLAMVQAHVFGPRPPFPDMPQRSPLQVRGYYYATGASLASRLALDVGPLYAGAEAAAHQFWSIDGFDRIELDGAPGDPEDVTDQRVRARATIGARPSATARVQLFGEGVLRRGAWDRMTRTTRELEGGVELALPF